ncbi:MAG TPA: response regulator, partial [Kouleothrix sp.]|nr:response regulator [Kouleothrix sp.]
MWIPTTHSNEAAMAYGAAYSRLPDPDPHGHILVIDDNRDAGAALAALLELSEHIVQHVIDGRTAFAAIEQRQPDLIILDVQLPDMDGYAICD